ncbi:hypothetical protein [Photorhabdus sp. RM323S]|uniref:hypothetical protein n=1 Tax=Photorhabdus sp. RM323S TaxID=3342828 RepID=UPI0036DDE886
MNKLPDTTKIFDLNKPSNTFFSTANSGISQNAFADKEVLISPEIPGHAITRVINDPEELERIANLNPSQSPIEKKNTIPEEKTIFEEKNLFLSMIVTPIYRHHHLFSQNARNQ